MKTLTASDRESLIKLASSMPKGDETRKAILAGLSNKIAFGKTKVILHRGRVFDYDVDEMEEFLDENGQVKPLYHDADNLPKWLHEAGASKMMVEYPGGQLGWAQNPHCRKFPGGGWSINGPGGWVQVSKIIQNIIDGDRMVTLNLRSDKREDNGMS